MSEFPTFFVLSNPSRIRRQASPLGHRCREQGINAGSRNLFIGAVAIHSDAEINSFDADFSAISTTSKLRVRLISRL